MSKKILRFTASWCGPCKSLAQNLEIANLGLPIEVIDIDVHDDVANDFGIRSVPTLVMMQDNIEVKRLVGSKPVNQLKEWAND
jgi:thioredoxin-like negative regulator of GroEL